MSPGDDGRARILVSAQDMIIRRRKDRFVAEIVSNVPTETHRRPPVAAATGLPDTCQISPVLLLRTTLFHILKNCSSRAAAWAAAAYAAAAWTAAAWAAAARTLILLLHLYLLAFFKFFSKLNIIFFSTIQYLSLLHYNTRCNTVHNNRFRRVPKWLVQLSRFKSSTDQNVFTTISRVANNPEARDAQEFNKCQNIEEMAHLILDWRNCGKKCIGQYYWGRHGYIEFKYLSKNSKDGIMLLNMLLEFVLYLIQIFS